MKNRLDFLSKRNQIKQELWTIITWGAIGMLLTEVIVWTGWAVRETVQVFAWGAFTMFLGISGLGAWRQNQIIVQNALAKAQWDKDREADIEQQAQVDQEIINKLKNDHSTLSGKEQDKRLLALEAALKHLRKQ